MSDIILTNGINMKTALLLVVCNTYNFIIQTGYSRGPIPYPKQLIRQKNDNSHQMVGRSIFIPMLCARCLPKSPLLFCVDSRQLRVQCWKCQRNRSGFLRSVADHRQLCHCRKSVTLKYDKRFAIKLLIRIFG